MHPSPALTKSVPPKRSTHSVSRISKGANMTYNVTKLLCRGVHEVCRKRIDGGVSHVGYFDSAAAALDVVKTYVGYEAFWASLNPISDVQQEFTINVLQPWPSRSAKEWYTRRTALFID